MIVASWYPAVDDVAKGRFVADQVAALIASGRVAPRIVSFDPIPLVGGRTARGRQASAINDGVGRAILVEPALFARTAFGVTDDAPIARLSVATGATPATGTVSAEQHRLAALLPLADRLMASPDRLPALVHAHTGYPDGAAAAALAERIDRPLVITEHATFLDRILAEPGQRARYTAAVASAARVIAVSELLARQIQTALPEFAHRVVVIPNTVAVDDFTAGGLEGRVPDELVFVGYRTEIKGIDTLLDAFAIVRAARPAAKLRLIGRSTTASAEAGWQARAAALGIADAVRFDGTADRAGVSAALARASVFVHAARYETFGVVAAEALAAGLPVVATDSGGVAEILGSEPDRLGAIVPVGDADALGAAVIRTLERRASFDAAILRAAVVDRFGSRAVAERLNDLYDEVIEEHRARRPAVSSPQPVSAAEPVIPRRTGTTVIIGLDRAAAAERIAQLPAELRRTVCLVTARSPVSVALGGLRALAEVAVAPLPEVPRARHRSGLAVVDRALRILADPMAALRRRMTEDQLAPRGVEAAARLVEAALAELAADSPLVDEGGLGDGYVRLLPIDGRDAAVAAIVAEALGVRLTTDGLRGLADRWLSDQAAPATG
jgi:glycogen(starch) synthase